MLTLRESSVVPVSGIECSLIRMSEKLRKTFNLQLGEFIVIKDVALQVEKAFEKDISLDPEVAYVTKNVMLLLGEDVDSFKLIKNVTLGCDPEFFLIDKIKRDVYCPSILFKKTGSLGYDGMLAELRPAPSIDPGTVTKHLEVLISTAKSTLIERKLDNVDMVARSSGWGHFAGFHVHLGIPVNLLDPHHVNYTKIIKLLVKSLDYFVSPLAMLAEGDDYTRRCSPYVNYGKIGDFRIDTRTLEYRVPGGALLRHPILTTGLLSLSSLVIHDAIEKLKIITNDFSATLVTEDEIVLKNMYPIIKNTKDLFNIVCTPDNTLAKKEADNILRSLSNMSRYSAHRQDIEDFMSLTEKYTTYNMCVNWNLNGANENVQ